MSEGDKEDFYKILGVEKRATELQIKTNYKKLALKYHPDRNPGDPKAAEQFKKISIAYAVLSDPNKRRQYDVSGPSGAILDYEGFDVSEVGGVGRVFCALFAKLGVPIPTQITPKVLAQARNHCEGKPTESKFSVLEAGVKFDGSIGKQWAGETARIDWNEDFGNKIISVKSSGVEEAAFFKITMKPEWEQCGLMIICKSPQMSKFKLVLFDKEGGVRIIQESNKRKGCTVAEIYFVPFSHAQFNEFFPMKFYMEDKETPLQFHLLDTFELISPHALEARDHYLCVYGDNWIKDAHYQLKFLPLNASTTSRRCINDIMAKETALNNKKTEMAKFQVEYQEAERKYKECVERLKRENEEITQLIKQREAVYEELETESQAPFAMQVSSNRSSKGFLSGWF